MGGMRNEEKWSGLVSAWRTSGLSAVEYARREGVSVHSLRHWAGRLKEADGGAVARNGRVRIARLVREDGSSSSAEGELVVEIGGARIAVRSGFDPATLRAVIEVLGAARSGDAG